MTDLVPPDDLVAIKAAWYAARERVHRLSTLEPEGDHTVPRAAPARRPGQSEPEPFPPIRLYSEEQSIALNTARAEEVELVLRLHRHPWKKSQPDVHAAEAARNEAGHTLWVRRQQSEVCAGGSNADLDGRRPE